MAEKTLKISPLSDNISKQDIISCLSTFSIAKVHKGARQGFIEFQSENDLEAFEFTFEDNIIPGLEGARFESVEENFRWEFQSSGSSEINELKEEEVKDLYTKSEDFVVNLTQPDSNSLITVSDCDQNILENMASQQIKEKIFFSFTSVNRILKKNTQIIVEIENPKEIEQLQNIFEDKKIKQLGENAYIDILADADPKFGELWIDQNRRQSPSRIKDNSSPKIESSQGAFSSDRDHCLHDDIIPKLNKVTSMESDFLMANEKVEQNQRKQINVIHEHEHENDHHQETQKQIQQQNSFLLQQKEEKQRLEAERIEKERQRKNQQQIEQKLRRQKEKQEERKRQEEKRKQKEEEQLRKIKEQEQRKQKQKEEQEKKLIQEQEKKQKEQQELEKKQKEEQERNKRLEQQRKQQQEEERMFKQRQMKEKERQQFERKRKMRELQDKQIQRQKEEKRKEEEEQKQRYQQQSLKQQKEKQLRQQEMRQKQYIGKEQQRQRMSSGSQNDEKENGKEQNNNATQWGLQNYMWGLILILCAIWISIMI